PTAPRAGPRTGGERWQRLWPPPETCVAAAHQRLRGAHKQAHPTGKPGCEHRRSEWSAWTQPPGDPVEEIDQASDVFLAGVQVHQVNPRPGAPAVAHGREPRLAGGDDAAGEFLLESVARHRVAVRRFEPRARDRELAALQDREAALGERPLQEP